MKPNQVRIGRIEQLIDYLKNRESAYKTANMITGGDSPTIGAALEEIHFIIEKIEKDFNLNE